MPQNEQPDTSADDRNADVPSSQRRVTPQELTLALTLLKAREAEAQRRREKEARSLAERVPLGPLIEQAGLAVTPEQIWAEVQALRARASPSSARETGQDAEPAGFAYRFLPAHHGDTVPASNRGGTLSPILLGFVALTVVLIALNSLCRAGKPIRPPRPPGFTPWPQGFPTEPSGLVPASPRPPLFQPAPRGMHPISPFGVTAPDAEFYRKLSLSQGPHPQYRILLRSLWGVATFGSGAMPQDQTAYPLNAVPDGCTFYKPQVMGVSFGVGGPLSLSCVFAERGSPASTQEWPMTRYNGRYYQHTWIPRSDIKWLKQGRRVFVYPSPSASGQMTPLTLAVGSHPTNCYSGSVPDTFEPCIQNAQNGPFLQLPEGKRAALDEHAWEDFTAFPKREYRPPAWDTEPGTFAPDREVGFGGTAGFDASSQVQPLQAVLSGVSIHCSSVTLDQMLRAYPYLGTIPQVLVDARPSLNRPWTVIKFGDRPYLRGWIAAHPARSLPAGREVAIYSNTDAPDFVNPPVQITVPLDTLKWRGTEGGASPAPDAPGTVGKVIVSDVRLDSHAWDKW